MQLVPLRGAFNWRYADGGAGAAGRPAVRITRSAAAGLDGKVRILTIRRMQGNEISGGEGIIPGRNSIAGS
jgi:hypothetical protein